MFRPPRRGSFVLDTPFEGSRNRDSSLERVLMTNEWKGWVLGRLALAIAAGLVFGIAPVALCHDLEENIEVLWSLAHEPELLAKATELQTPVAIYEFVRNNIRFVSYHGSRSSSVNTFLGQIGNDVDIASTLIAMLR